MAGWDEEIGDEPDYAADRAAAAAWARDLLARDDWVILDTETTGLEYGSEPISIAILAPSGETVLSTYVFPHPEGGNIPIPTGAVARHGLTMGVLRERCATTFPALWPVLQVALAGKRIVVYNATCDEMIVRYAVKLIKGQWLTNEWVDAMEPYAAFCGQWHPYFRSYTWQKLPGTTHDAAADCHAVLALLRRMAAEATPAPSPLDAVLIAERARFLGTQRAADVAAGLPACRMCGCTQNAGCDPRCWWAEPDLCSSCAGKGAPAKAVQG